MGERALTRREVLAVGAAGALAVATEARALPPRSPDDEFIRVAADRWSFETAATRRRFVPFGANLVLTSKEDLDIFGPRYTTARYERILDAAAGVGVNILKVFLPVGSVLPDPQTPGEVRIAPGYLDNLDDFLRLCRARSIRASVCLSEWGVHSCRWWQEGGQYFGRIPWRTDPGIDCLDVLCRFWRILCTRLRDTPAVFSYTPCVEWSLPNGNMTPPWRPPEEDIGLVKGDIGIWHWRAWALAKYGSLDAANRAWGTRHARPEEIPLVDYRYDAARKAYFDSDARVLDYQNFREWASMRYFRPQIATIRAVDPNHMVTISNHMRSWNLWEGAARHFLGYTPAEQAPLLDYMTHHANYDESILAGGRTMESVVREIEVMCRFAHAGRPMPVVIEEHTFATTDPARTAEAHRAIARGTVGHAMGWMTWYLQFPEGANEADTPNPMAWLNNDFSPTPWGRGARDLRAELERGDLRRKRARRVVRLDRARELVPKALGALTAHYLQSAQHPGPIDYRVERERDLDLRLPGDVTPRRARLRCAPLICGALRQWDSAFATREGAAGWRRELADERALGFNLLWLGNIAPAIAPGAPAGGLEVALDACAEMGFGAILDAGSTPSWWTTLDAQAERRHVAAHVHEVARRCGQHPAFLGWYVPHEIYQAWDRKGAYIDEVYPAFVATCREATPGKLVTVSPFFFLDRDRVIGDFRYAEPEEYRDYWARLLRRSRFDVVKLQDSGHHMSFITMEQRRPFFAAMREACRIGGARLWGNVEAAEFEIASVEEYIRRFGRVHHSTVRDAPWRAVPICRLEEKLRLAAEYSERIVSWGYNEFGRPHLGPKARAWYEDYRRYVRRVRTPDRRASIDREPA
ncbi:MAG TPA: DUF4434 domain-containing protein [Chthonomonadales bacterium]|nr:DUF4434 domain-containing protein [Chthonomonadales bacterium]